MGMIITINYDRKTIVNNRIRVKTQSADFQYLRPETVVICFMFYCYDRLRPFTGVNVRFQSTMFIV